jgi:hypothetical protein
MTQKEIAEKLMEFKRMFNPVERREKCPFHCPGVVRKPCVACENCRVIFPLLKKRAPINIGPGHACPCTVYMTPYVKRVVRKFIKKWR